MRQVLAVVLLMLLLQSGESYRSQESPTGPTGLSCQQLWPVPTPWPGLGLKHWPPLILAGGRFQTSHLGE